MKYLLYEELRKRLQLFSLGTGRLREVMSEVYKILKVVDKVNADLSFTKFCNMKLRASLSYQSCFLEGWVAAHSSDIIPRTMHSQVALEEKG